jgi:hypothetical protein
VNTSNSIAHEILDEVRAFVLRFVVFPDAHCSTGLVLWIAHTYLIAELESTPRLAVISAEKQSGKTRVLELAQLLAHEPLLTANISPAALYRRIEKGGTLLFDEVDTIFGMYARDDAEALRAIINAGYRRGAYVTRCEGDAAKIATRDFHVFAAVALAGIGDIPDTIMDRSIAIHMKRRRPEEQVEPFRRRHHEPRALELAARLKTAMASLKDVGNRDPAMPEGIVDRLADVWEPLFAIADCVGGEWPCRAREAAVALSAIGQDAAPSQGVQLLFDIRNVFANNNVDKIFTEDLIKALTDNPELPWRDLRGRPIDANVLSKMLKAYDVAPRTIRIETDTKRGYRLDDFYDSFERYLASLGEQFDREENDKWS